MLFFRKVCGLYMWISAVTLFVLLYSFIIYNMASELYRSTISEEENNILLRIDMAKQALESLEQKKYMLEDFLNEFKSSQLNHTAAKNLVETLGSKLHYPNMEYEKLRRRVRQNTAELWNYFSSELNKIKKRVSVYDPELFGEIDNIIELGTEHKASLISDIDQMRNIDGYEQWRHDEAKSLSDLVQRRLHYLQNPTDCENARKLVCSVKMRCGSGCLLHHVIYCFMLAYATERTLVIGPRIGAYNTSAWEDIFLPVSETCQIIDLTTPAEKWPGQNDSLVIELEVRGQFIIWLPFLPHSIPADLAPRLNRLHGEPAAWWVGQLFKYLLRSKNATNELFETRMETLGFKKPIVGVHIRRTDKVGNEADFHCIEEYMTHVEDYFLQLEINGINIKRRIYLASDEASLIDEARTKYPSYEIICDPDIAEMAEVSTRYTDSSLIGIISDVHILSLCDYLVCTFSSNICRMAYELMQTMYPDASTRLKSIDDIYYYVKPIARNSEAVLSHHPRHLDEIYMMQGDKIAVSMNHWDGYSTGRNLRTEEIGLFPSFKVNKELDILNLPTYANVT